MGDLEIAGTALGDYLAGSALAREVERVSVRETVEEERLAIALGGSASVLSRHTGAYDLKRVAESQGGGEQQLVLIGILVVIFRAVAGSTGGAGSTAAGDFDGAAEAEGLSGRAGL